jgi:hypothetical protein
MEWLAGIQIKEKNMANKYRAAKGARYNHKDAQIIGTHLERLGGEFTPDRVLDEAQKSRSPIHKYFEWDDTEAARQHRLLQARNLVNHLLLIITIDGEEVPTKAFHSIELQIDDETAGREYSSFEVILNDPDRKEQVVERALAEVDAWQARWLHYSEVFGGVFKAVDKVKKSKKISALIN